MGQVYGRNDVVVTVDGLPLTAHLLHWLCTMGSRPSEAVVSLPNLYLEDVSNSTYRGKVASVSVDGATILTGHVERIRKVYSQSEQSHRLVVLTLMDKRSPHAMNKTYIGAGHLETLDGDGLPTGAFVGLKGLGSDVTFNLNGKPNKLAASLAFSHIGGHNTTGNADYWTYGEIIAWIWANYITDVAAPTPGGTAIEDLTWGGLNKKAEQLSLFGLPVLTALERVLSHTRANWYLDGDGNAAMFDVDNPGTTLALAFADPTTQVNPSAYSLDTPEEFDVEESLDDSVAQLDIIGGRSQRECWLHGYTDFAGHSSTALGPVASGGTDLAAQNIWQNVDVNWYSNYANVAGGIRQWKMRSDRFEAHLIGPNLTDNEQRYRMLPNLLAARDVNGHYVAVDADNAMYSVSPWEILTAQYPDGASMNLDDLELSVNWRSVWLTPGGTNLVQQPIQSVDPPVYLSAVMECAYRTWVSAATAVEGAPATVRRAVLRDEFVNKTREATYLPMPVTAFYSPANLRWDIAQLVPTPAGSTKQWTTPQDAPLVPMLLCVKMTAGVVVDGMGPLNEIKAAVSDYVGLRNVNGTGSFPSWRTLMPGTRITATPNYHELTGTEIVTGVVFHGDTQRLEFSFTNRLGSDVSTLTEQFIDTRQFRRAL